jgi:radical SAM protein with 4Fe4S-binding SPASM domain
MKKLYPPLAFKIVKEAYTKTKFPDIFYLKIKNPIEMQIELTSKCNQKCIFCYNVWKEGCSTFVTKKNFSKEEHLKIINKIIENEIFSIIFSGGEPLLISYLEELIERLTKENIDTTLITNGILLTKERALSLKKAGLDFLQISLHHFSKEENYEIVGNEGAYDKTVQGIKNAIEVFGPEGVNINMVALTKTHKDVYKMASFLNSLGVKSFSIGAPSVTGEMSNNLSKGIVIDKEKFLDIYNQLKMAERDFGMKVSFTGGFPICILPDFEKNIGMVNNYCDAGLNQLVIGPYGDIRPCVCLSDKVGNIFKDDLKEIWKNNKLLLNLRELEYSPKACKKCKYLSICRGGCRASARGYSGKLNATDPIMN